MISERDLQRRLQAAARFKRGAPVIAVRDFLNLHPSAADVDTSFQPRLKAGARAMVVGHQAHNGGVHYRIQMLDADDFVTDWWLVVPESTLGPAPLSERQRSGLSGLFFRIFSTD